MTKTPRVLRGTQGGERGDRRDVAVPTAFSERVAEIYTAPQLSAEERRAFDSRLMERIETPGSSSRRTRPWLGLALAPIAAAAALSLLWLSPAEETMQQTRKTEEQRIAAHRPLDAQMDGQLDAQADGLPDERPDERIEAAATSATAGSLEESMIAVATGPVSDPSEGLPDDYAAIDSLLFGS